MYKVLYHATVLCTVPLEVASIVSIATGVEVGGYDARKARRDPYFCLLVIFGKVVGYQN